MPQFEDMTIFTGNANPELAEAIATRLRMELGHAQVFEFSNENIFVKIDESVRENDVFIIRLFPHLSRSLDSHGTAHHD